MGLDITLYKVEPIPIRIPRYIKKEELSELSSDIYKPYFFIKSNKKVCDTIKKHSLLLMVKEPIVDMCKLKAIYNIDDEIADEEISIIPVGKNFQIDVRNKFLTYISCEEYINITFDESVPYLGYVLSKITYQRGLVDEGWKYLPDNCVLCDDKDLVKKLVKNGLDSSFIDKWVDGETVIEAWW